MKYLPKSGFPLLLDILPVKPLYNHILPNFPYWHDKNIEVLPLLTMRRPLNASVVGLNPTKRQPREEVEMGLVYQWLV